MSDMNDKVTNQHKATDPASYPNQPDESEKSPIDEKVVDTRDLVYKGGYTKDPQEILSNPAVAPQMYTEGRDLRTDIFREAEAATPEPSEEPGDD
ncbi:hypothetical protein [Egbenema bharatensis]|uniref:hypothetical protein n=1 Tax=Egbenema bharatensis TaxID=3463334 RepID=UPI003A893C1D